MVVFVLAIPLPDSLYGLGVIWLLALVVGMSAVSTRNKKIDEKEGVEELRHQENAEATSESSRRIQDSVLAESPINNSRNRDSFVR